MRRYDPATITSRYFAEACPDRLSHWHFRLNGTTDPHRLLSTSTKKAWWACDGHLPFQQSVASVARYGFRCPGCAEDAALAVIAAFWHPTLNGDLRPEDVSPDSTREVFCLCPDGHTTLMAVNRRYAGEPCRRCSPTSLRRTHPGLASEWHPTKNGDLLPEDVTHGMPRRVWWLCPTCGWDWQTRIHDRTRSGSGCPECVGKRGRQGVAAQDSLSVRRPDLLAQWLPTRNRRAIDPGRMSLTSTRTIWWQCERTHEWQATIVDRVKGRAECPFCAGTPEALWRSLEWLKPNLAAQWHPTKNGDLRPEDVDPSSPRSVHWLCQHCNCQWEHSILKQVRGRMLCPNIFCRGRHRPRDR